MVAIGQILSRDTDGELGVVIRTCAAELILVLCVISIPAIALHITDHIVTNLREYGSLWCDVDIESTGVNQHIVITSNGRSQDLGREWTSHWLQTIAVGNELLDSSAVSVAAIAEVYRLGRRRLGVSACRCEDDTDVLITIGIVSRYLQRSQRDTVLNRLHVVQVKRILLCRRCRSREARNGDGILLCVGLWVGPVIVVALTGAHADNSEHGSHTKEIFLQFHCCIL